MQMLRRGHDTLIRVYIKIQLCELNKILTLCWMFLF